MPDPSSILGPAYSIFGELLTVISSPHSTSSVRSFVYTGHNWYRRTGYVAPFANNSRQHINTMTTRRYNAMLAIYIYISAGDPTVFQNAGNKGLCNVFLCNVVLAGE